MDIEAILKRGEFQHPLFAEFILRKYEDLKHFNRRTADKIEQQVFTPEFLKGVLENGDRLLRFNMLEQVPADAFATVASDIESLMDETSSPGRSEIVAGIFNAVAPEQFQKYITGKINESLSRASEPTDAFSWLKYYAYLSEELKQRLFEETFPRFTELGDSLELSPRHEWVLKNVLSAAFHLNPPGADLPAKLYLNYLITAYDEEEIGFYKFCSDLRCALVPEDFEKEGAFEMNLFFRIEEGHVRSFSQVLDQFYEDTWGAESLFDFFRKIIQSDEPLEIPELIDCLDQSPKSARFKVIKSLLEDGEIKKRLNGSELEIGVAGVFGALLWQCRQKPCNKELDIPGGEVVELLCQGDLPEPFLEQVHARLENSPSEEIEFILGEAMEISLKKLEKDGSGTEAMTNILKLMVKFPNPLFAPFVAKVFLPAVSHGSDEFYTALRLAAAGLGDDFIIALDPLVQEVPEFMLLEVLEVIRIVDSLAADTFLNANFDLFIRAYPADTLETCRSLVSQKALARLEHKVGKNQPGVDELYVIVKTFAGEADSSVQEVLRSIKANRVDNILDLLDSDQPLPVVSLELECRNCGDISRYECCNVYVFHDGKAYVAEELTCISCDRISEFDITTRGSLVVMTEAIRLTGDGKEEDDTIPGAVKIMNTAFMGKPMSMNDGIALYKKHISKKPKNPEHRIGLGNAYKGAGQYFFAREQYTAAIKHGPFYIEAYWALAGMEEENGEPKSALGWLEKGRPYLKRPLICKDMQVSAEEILDNYMERHFELLKKTGSDLAPIKYSEIVDPGISLIKIGKNEKCPCGSRKKYKKCCMKKL